MHIIGIDPGIAIVGFGVIDKQGNQLKPVQYGSIQTEAGLSVPLRLRQIFEAMQTLLDTYKPDEMAVEKLFFNKNVTTAFTVGQARGVILLAAELAGIPVYEYTPMQVKQAVTGYGGAEKKQIQEMTKMLLRLKETPKPDDVADALGIAITHAQFRTFISLAEGVRK
ncbi:MULTISPECIES: crossover junction endodeoxyribonuclease RuvC [Brevibacillus]|jgi:crossover junction endodeoxyribonuclease RuvC|uniref:Crossover junction endodeoxyribonuclease RuvC n=1 Tax=Brevibacillus borstelensis AK1 TaxID=1300222 RepID=M8DH41_9BACL|nr:crossover junction endodeoxyribonuclease RuvC [Brevibacillus borstelensis]EMT52772.1 crossover junction endodeoxyribonuclease [Brevibacillus borstelensis AK1]KKX55798.1 Holliday junction resolvase [Brevibacillus borstelensis cifa_chp40]MBE5394561.1 crossover junction endodeoxyribonuclease RuvC [Brevibacillus borstelensis]MCC0565038.1 crossover junction endodeoxyribonuclease RuvC [Brevibacillus borstelensis]MCM3473258.1 crossover junction endodeoxyribonuclease RuvC [Brevibacillus borstelensi